MDRNYLISVRFFSSARDSAEYDFFFLISAARSRRYAARTVGGCRPDADARPPTRRARSRSARPPGYHTRSRRSRERICPSGSTDDRDRDRDVHRRASCPGRGRRRRRDAVIGRKLELKKLRLAYDLYSIIGVRSLIYIPSAENRYLRTYSITEEKKPRSNKKTDDKYIGRANGVVAININIVLKYDNILICGSIQKIFCVLK